MAKRKGERLAKRLRGGKWLAGLLATLVLATALVAAGGSSHKSGANSVGAAVDLPAKTVVEYRMDLGAGAGSGSISTSGGKGNHTGWILIDSFSWGLKSPKDASTGQATGKVQFATLKVTKKFDQFSPMIAGDAAENTAIPKMVLEGLATKGNNQTVYMRFTLTTLAVSSYQIGGDGGTPNLPTDMFEFVYGQVDFEYVGPDPALSNGFTCSWSSPC
jgi:type VI secretion system Hcp family effector